MFMLMPQSEGGGGGGGGGRAATAERSSKQVQATIKKNLEKQRRLANEQGGGDGAGEGQVNAPSRPPRRQKKPKETQQEPQQEPQQELQGESLEERIEEMMAGTRRKEEQEKAEEQEQIDLLPIVDAVFGQKTVANRLGLHLKGSMEGPVTPFLGKAGAGSQRGMQQEGTEDKGIEEKELKDPFCALVKNCNMLHNIVGPTCIFLKQGFTLDRELSPEEIEELHDAFLEFAKGTAKEDGGYISQADLGECMRTMGYMPTEMELIELAMSLGSKIDFEDWCELMGPKVVAETACFIGVKELRDAFKEFDTNGDGKINIAELREASKKLLGEQLPNSQIEEIVRDVDLNGDGLVDFEEFVRMMSR